MDLDTPSSRDPRLASQPTRPPPLRNPSLNKQATSSLDSPGTPKSAVLPPPNDPPRPVERDDNPRDGSFIQSISEFVQASVATAMSRSEKERLQKKKEMTGGLLKKAKAHTNFPSTAAFFQQASNDENLDLTRMDDTIKERLSNCSQIERDLVTKWGFLSPSGSGSSTTEETIKSLQNELQTVKQEAANTKAELTKLVDSSLARNGPVKILQDRVIFLEKSLGNQSSILTQQARNVKASDERFASLSSEIKKGAIPSTTREAPSTQYQSDIDDLKQKQTDVDSTVKALIRCQEAVSKSLDQVNTDMEDQRRKLNDVNVGPISAMKKRMDDFSNHLSSLAGKVAGSPTVQSVNGNVDSTGAIRNMEQRLKTLEGNQATPHTNKSQANQNMQVLNARMEELAHLQAMKDDLHFSEMEDIKKTLAQHNGEFRALKDDYSQVSTDIKNIALSNPAAALQQVQALSGSLQGTQRVLESVKVGLHSLETRYNNISTEPIVKNMVIAMQEMYPSASQLTEQVAALRSHIKKDILPLRSAVDQLIKSYGAHSTQFTHIQRDAALQLEERNRLRTEHARVEKSVAGLSERVNAQGSLPNQQEFNQLQSNVEILSKRMNEHTSNISEQLMSKQSSDEALVQNLNRERDHFSKEFQRLSSELKELMSIYSQLQSANITNIEMTQGHAGHIESLLDRMRHLEESASNNHEQLLEQFDNIKKAVESQEIPPMDGLVTEDPLSPQQKVEGDEEFEIAEERAESPVNGDSTITHIAETNPALALREKKRKKKRPRPSTNASDDERPPEPQSRSNSPGWEGTPGTDGKKKGKKKKRRKLIRDTEPVTLD